MPKYRFILFLLLIAIFGVAQTAQDEASPVRALMTDSFVVEIDHPPATVWAHIKRLYFDGERYRQRGLDLSPIKDDPSAFLGGYRGVSKPGADAPAPELVVHFSAVDDENMFLAMYMDGLLPRGIYITHDVSPSGDGSRYQVIIHAFINVELAADEVPTVEAVNEWMTARVADHNRGLEEIVMNEIVKPLK